MGGGVDAALEADEGSGGVVEDFAERGIFA